MELTVSSWFNEPGINFRFSHKVDLYIRDQIKEHIMAPLGLIDSYPGKFLSLNVTTEEKRTKLEIHLGPKWSLRTNHRTHGLWFPYHQIVDSDYPLREYLHLYMNCLPEIFLEFGVTPDQIAIVRLNCEENILHNSDFELTKVELEEYERTDKLSAEIKNAIRIELI